MTSTTDGACVEETITQCDPPPGRDYAEAIADAAYSNVEASTTQCMYCSREGEVPCNLKVTATSSYFGNEGSFQVFGPDSEDVPMFSASFATDYQTVEQTFMTKGPGTYTVVASDSFGDGWGPLPQTLMLDNAELTTECSDYYYYSLPVCFLCLFEPPGSLTSWNDVASKCQYECASHEASGAAPGPGPGPGPGPASYSEYFCLEALYDDGLGGARSWEEMFSGTVILSELSDCTDDDGDASTPDVCVETPTTMLYVHEYAGFPNADGWQAELTVQCGTVAEDTAALTCAYADCECEQFNELICDAPYGQGSGPVWLGGVHCDGDEGSLCSCRQDGSGVGSSNPVDWGAGGWLSGCTGSHSKDAGVVCMGTQEPQPPRMQDCDGVCIPAKLLGDGWCDAGDRVAQLNCEQLGCDAGDCDVDCQPAPVPCPVGRWRCDDGTCIEGDGRCNRVPECEDKSDERNCEGVFCCKDGTQCVPASWMNDGWPDCLDASDEPAGLLDKYIYNLHNGYCRAMLPMCDIYLFDRGLSCSESILPAEGCSPMPGHDEQTGFPLPPEWGDGVCQPMCGTELCKFDNGDCPVGLDMLACDRLLDPEECPSRADEATCEEHSQCHWHQPTTLEDDTQTGSCVDDPDGFYWDDTCDLMFNNSACGYDNGECLKCSWNDPGYDCDSSFLGDGFCDMGCMSASCGNDAGDCPAIDEETCPIPSTSDSLGDGTCDMAYNTPECGCDNGQLLASTIPSDIDFLFALGRKRCPS